MLLKFFKSNLPYVVIFVPILGFLLWLPSLLPGISIKQVVINEAHTPFYNTLTEFFASNYYLNIISALIICILQSFLLIRLNFKYIFIESKTYLPAIVFIIINSSIIAFQQLNPALIANLFVLFAFDRCFIISKERNLFQRYFEAGVFIGISTLIYPPSIYLMVFVWLTQIILRTINWREWLTSAIGVIGAISFYFTIAYLRNNLVVEVNQYLSFFSIFTKASDSLQGYSLISIVTLGVIFFIAFLFSLRIIGTKKINSRKYLNLFVWIIFATILAFIFIPNTGLELIYFISIPLSIIYSLFLIEIRNKYISEFFFALLWMSSIFLIWF